MSEKLKAMRGTHDILPEEARVWRVLETTFVDVYGRYGYAEIRVPVFEATELFERGTGFATDVVQKEAYSFLDKKGRRLSLRPEATPSVILKSFLKDRLNLLCGDCNDRYARNPMRVLDCKVGSCRTTIRQAPEVGTVLCEECVRHFDRVKACLTEAGIAFSVDAKLVRGLHYYTRTVFEFFHEALGIENSVGGGGRYDNLVEEIGGPATPAVGFSAGLERLVAAVESEGSLVVKDDAIVVFVASLGERALVPAFRLAAQLRERYTVWLEFDQRRIERQMGTSAKMGARYTLIIGEDEIAKDVVKTKNVGSGEQAEIKAGSVLAYLETGTGGERLE